MVRNRFKAFLAFARRLTRRLVDGFGQPTKSLAARIALAVQYHLSIAEIAQLFQDQQTHHQADGLGGPALSLGKVLGEGTIQLFRPGDNLCRMQQRVARIRLQQQVGAKEVGLVACA